MKRIDLFFAALLVPLDYLMLLAAGWVAYQLRFHQIADFLPVVSPLAFGPYMRLVAVVAVGWLMILAMAGVFAVRQRRLSSELGRIFFGVSTAVLIIIVLIFFQREFFTSRFIILAGWILSVVLVWIMHSVVRGIQRLLLRRGVGARNIVVIGQDQITNDLLKLFRTSPSLGFRVIQQFPDVSLDSLRQIEQLVKQGAVDEVVQTDPHLPRGQTLQVLELCQEHDVVFKYAADIFATQASHVDIDDVAGVPIIEVKRTPLDGWGRIFKRTLDLTGAVIGIILLCIPGLIIAIIIKLDSAGSVFIQLDRAGQGQRRFKLWKFRSMIKDAHGLRPMLLSQNERSDGPLFKLKNDPRVTRIGRFIRKTSIDELPQLFNVLRGEMSLVGPRPHEPEEVARYEKSQKKLLAIKPGMTGMAQVSGRTNLSFSEEARVDTYYLEHWSLGLDLTILVRTPMAVLRIHTTGE